MVSLFKARLLTKWLAKVLSCNTFGYITESFFLVTLAVCPLECIVYPKKLTNPWHVIEIEISVCSKTFQNNDIICMHYCRYTT